MKKGGSHEDLASTGSSRSSPPGSGVLSYFSTSRKGSFEGSSPVDSSSKDNKERRSLMKAMGDSFRSFSSRGGAEPAPLARDKVAARHSELEKNLNPTQFVAGAVGDKYKQAQNPNARAYMPSILKDLREHVEEAAAVDEAPASPESRSLKKRWKSGKFSARA